jgi:hypothetical protein
MRLGVFAPDFFRGLLEKITFEKSRHPPEANFIQQDLNPTE